MFKIVCHDPDYQMGYEVVNMIGGELNKGWDNVTYVDTPDGVVVVMFKGTEKPTVKEVWDQMVKEGMVDEQDWKE